MYFSIHKHVISLIQFDLFSDVLKLMAFGRISSQNKYRAAAAELNKRQYYDKQRSLSNDDLLVE